jgi:hypothetical protein
MAATNRYIDGLEPVIGFSGYTGGDLVTSPRARDFRGALLYIPVLPDDKTSSKRSESVEMWKTPEKRTAASRQKKAAAALNGPETGQRPKTTQVIWRKDREARGFGLS